MEGIRDDGENGRLLARRAFCRSLSKKMYRVGYATAATGLGGMSEKLVAAPAAHSGQAVGIVFILSFIALGGVGTIYAGRRVELEHAPTPRFLKAGVAIYFFCVALLVTAVSLVGSDYYELALNFIDNN